MGHDQHDAQQKHTHSIRRVNNIIDIAHNLISISIQSRQNASDNIYVYGTQQINTATAVHFVNIYYLFIRRFHFNNEGRHYDCARFDSEQ